MRSFSRSLFLVFPCAVAGQEGGAPHPWGPFPDGVPGSGYGCDRTCSDAGDVHFEIEARLEKYSVPGSGAFPDFDSDAKMFTRTFIGTKGPFCSMSDSSHAYDGTEGALGPCLQVKPGQTMTIKLINQMENGMSALHQAVDTRQNWWDITASSSADGQPDYLDHGDTVHWGPRPAKPADLHINITENIPGWAVSFDATNIHLHGMQVVPHLFYPLGSAIQHTHWISVTPASEDKESQCFCYVFKVPEDHPMGTYMWHVHRHGSTAMQAWQGMLGVMKVDNNAAGSPTKELISQNVKRDQDFVMWEWAVDGRSELEPGVFAEGSYVFMADGGPDGDPTTLMLVNNEYQPRFSLKKGESMHVRVVCAQATTGTAWYLLDQSGNLVDFYVFASDGISYKKTYKKQVLLMGPGQREGVLVQFPAEGTYRVMQGLIADFNEDDADIGPGDNSPDEPIAFFDVSGSDSGSVDLSKLTFTPGIRNNINEKDISQQLAVDFSVGTDLNTLPMPQFMMNKAPFDVTKNVLTVNAGSVASWHLTSSMNFFHPFHIHVNPFQVKSIDASGVPPRLRPYLTADPPLVWRDTVFIPPNGAVEAVQRFGSENGVAWQGKTVFHCHFFDHEDQGMIGAFLITDTSTTTTTPSGPVEHHHLLNHLLGKCLDVPGGDFHNGAKLQIWECLSGSLQDWSFSDGTVQAFASSDPYCLDLPDNKMTNGKQLEIWACQGTPQQQWGYDADMGTIYLSNSGDASKCMGVLDGNKCDGAPVVLWDCSGAPAQAWYHAADPPPTPVPCPPPAPPAFALVHQAAQKCLDLPGGDTKNGNPLWLWACEGSEQQGWVFKSGMLAYSELGKREKCVDVPGNDQTNGNRLQIWDCSGLPQQLWGYDEQEGTMYLSSSALDATKCMDLLGGSTDNGAAVVLWDCNGDDNQAWQLAYDKVSSPVVV